MHRIVAAVGALVLGVGAVIGLGTAAQAAPPTGMEFTLLDGGGNVVADAATVPEGTQLTLQLKYKGTQLSGGESVTVKLGDGVHVQNVPTGNAAIQSVTDNGDGTVTILFKNPIPSDVDQGVYSMTFTTGPVDENTNSGVSWEYPGGEEGVTFVIEDKVTPPTTVTDKYEKSASPNNLNSFVDVVQDPANDGYYKFNGLKSGVEDQEITYTLVLDSKDARTNYKISDVLAAGLGYVSGSFTANVTTYDPTTTNPIAFTPTVTDGASGATSSFSGTLTSVPANSHIVITYKAKVRDVAYLNSQLQAAFDAKAGDVGHFTGNFSVTQPNTATFGTDDATTKTANVTFQGTVPGPCTTNCGNDVFSKTASWTSLQVDADADGRLTPAAGIEYTFKANLGHWDQRNPDFVLSKNVVIDDTLPAQATWNTASGFIAASASGTGSALALSDVNCPATRAEFAADSYVDKYCVIGQTLWVNVGKDRTRGTVTVVAKAEVNTVTGLAVDNTKTTIKDSTAYVLPNTAKFTSNGTDENSKGTTSYPIVLPKDRDGGLNDTSVFTKAANNKVVAVEPGQSATVPYTFTVNTQKGGIDPRESKIVDYVDTTVFDISNPASINVTGKYGNTNLVASDFVLSTNADGNLEIALSTAGKAKVTTEGLNKIWTVDLPLTTHVLEGKKTFEITNKATLFGASGDPMFWSNDDSEATSFGDEAEVRKRLYDEVTSNWADSSNWTDNVNAETDADGKLLNDTFVYRVQFIPRGGYNNVVIFDVVDTLPAGTTFLGFVAPGDVHAESPSMGPVDIGGNIEAVYANGTVTLTQKNGTRLNANAGDIAAYFAVKLENAKEPVINKIGNTEAKITPFGPASIDIEKWNDEGATPEYDASGALLNDGFVGDRDSADDAKALKAGATLPIHFTISNDGLDDLTDVVVSDELTGGKGAIEDLSCDFSALDPNAPSSGTTWAGPFLVGTQFSCSGTLPALASGDTHADLAKVTAKGILSGTEVEDEDAWHGEVLVPSIDIEKWSDEGATPLYDQTGKLTNDGYVGDFDTAKGKKLEVGKDQLIHFTISNDGPEDLVNVKVGDARTGGVGDVQNVVCTFPDDSTGLEWAGPFLIGTQFSCTGTLPGLQAGQSHSDRATVTATGATSGVDVDDADDWNGYTEAAMANTGAQFQGWLIASGAALLLAGGVLMLVRRSNRRA